MKEAKVETPTDVLIKALENAEAFEHVIVIYQRKEESPTERGNHLGSYSMDETKLETLNFMLDSYKAWLWSSITRSDD